MMSVNKGIHLRGRKTKALPSDSFVSREFIVQEINKAHGLNIQLQGFVFRKISSVCLWIGIQYRDSSLSSF